MVIGEYNKKRSWSDYTGQVVVGYLVGTFNYISAVGDLLSDLAEKHPLPTPPWKSEIVGIVASHVIVKNDTPRKTDTPWKVVFLLNNTS